MPSITMAGALNQALDQEMERDDRVFLIGEDIPDPVGGPFQVTKGLSSKYGADRVLDSPISEQAIVGAATGAAMAGMRPVAEIMICDFLGVCMDQLANHAAKLRFMSGGATTVPMVIRTMGSGGINFGGQHSQMLEAWLVHTPGLKVCVPSTPADAKGLLTAAIRDPDPVVVIEPCVLYATEGEVPESEHSIPSGSADVKREGSDVTIVTYGRQVHDSLAAAEAVKDEAGVEVIDLRWLQPWDVDTVLASVEKTGRVVIVHQAVERAGFGAEIAAVLQERLFGKLKAPIVRVAGKNTPVPYATELESFHIPSAGEIADAVRRVMKP
jgi:acetoin:2,6-dichlorophenolindophenol oxidoreductase subunit beta